MLGVGSVWIRFVGLTWEQLGEYYSERAGKVNKAKKWAEKRTLSPSTFKSICFDGAQFKGTVDFSNRTFLGQTTFNPVKKSGNTSFAVAPQFHNCKLHQDTSFFRLEMAEEAERATGMHRLLYKAYSLLSDYGYSLARPGMLLLATLLIMTLI